MCELEGGMGGQVSPRDTWSRTREVGGDIPVMWRGWTRSDEVDQGPQSVARLRVTSQCKTGSEYSLPRGAEGRVN